MPRLETQLEDETYCTEPDDADIIIDEMQNHKDIHLLCELYVKRVLSPGECIQILDNIYLDAKEHLSQCRGAISDWD